MGHHGSSCGLIEVLWISGGGVPSSIGRWVTMIDDIVGMHIVASWYAVNDSVTIGSGSGSSVWTIGAYQGI